MKRIPGPISLLAFASLCLLGGCGGPSPAPSNEPAGETQREPLVPSRLLSNRAATTPLPTDMIQGSVIETLEAGPYTYVRVNDGEREHWVAAAEAPVAAGDVVRFSTSMPMSNFESKTLGRTFELVYFTQTVSATGASGAAPPGGPRAQTQPADQGADHGRAAAGAPAGLDLTGIAVPEGGMSVTAVIDGAAGLAGQAVLVRGRVAKFTPAVMDHNWLHVQDASGADGVADLAVISDGEATVGDLVTIEGEVAVNQNFGFGYEYAVLVKDALITVE